jgi:hypothetical protein
MARAMAEAADLAPVIAELQAGAAGCISGLHGPLSQ